MDLIDAKHVYTIRITEAERKVLLDQLQLADWQLEHMKKEGIGKYEDRIDENKTLTAFFGGLWGGK